MAEWFVRWPTKLATWVRSLVAMELLIDYSVLCGNLPGDCYQLYQPRLDNRGGNGHAPWALLETSSSIHTRWGFS